ANMINAFDVETIMLGGGIMNARDQLLPLLKVQIVEKIVGYTRPVAIRAAKHPNSMALLGGEWLIKEKLEA
ncbi:MAG: ROK family protein, partial [Gammaproteobacteria bacterium]